jgi:hypothetical protein
MKQRPPGSDDETSEEQAPDFDGTATLQLDDTYRVRVVTASEANDVLGTDADGATDRHKSLESPALDLAAREPQLLEESGCDADATGQFVLPKIDS